MKRWISILAKFALAALLTFACFELYFRATEISLPSFVAGDPVLGRTFRPNARAALYQEGFYLGQVNDDGYLGPSYPSKKPAETFRVVLNGNSYVEAFQLFPKYCVRSVLETELAALVTPGIEVLNFGRSGKNLRSAYTYYKDFARRYDPDVALFILTDTSFISGGNRIGPRCYLDDEGELQVSYDFAETAAYRRKAKLGFTRWFGSYQIMQNALNRLFLGEAPRILFDKFVPRERAAEVQTPGRGGKDEYVELNTAVIRELARMDEEGPTRIIIVGHRGVPDYYPSIIEEAGLEYIDLDPELARFQSTGVDPYYWPITGAVGHWNHDGSRFIGAYLAERLKGYAGE